jgi:hypothetical protein
MAHGNVVVRRLARAGDAPDFSSLQARGGRPRERYGVLFREVAEG